MNPMAARRLEQFILARAKCIDAGMTLQRGRVTQALGSSKDARWGQQLADQRLDFIHQGRLVEPDAVPLDHREFRVVPTAALGVSKDLADLIDVAAAGSQ